MKKRINAEGLTVQRKKYRAIVTMGVFVSWVCLQQRERVCVCERERERERK